MPSYVKFINDILSKKRKLDDHEIVALIGECSIILQRNLSQKLKHPESFIIPCTIEDQFLGKALSNLGASINLVSYSVF